MCGKKAPRSPNKWVCLLFAGALNMVPVLRFYDHPKMGALQNHRHKHLLRPRKKKKEKRETNTRKEQQQRRTKKKKKRESKNTKRARPPVLRPLFTDLLEELPVPCPVAQRGVHALSPAGSHKKGAPYCGWAKSISHHSETMVETIACWYLQGES